MRNSYSSIDVSLEGIRIHVRQWGEDGQPIILVHGLASTSHIWDLVAPKLTDLGQVLAFDQRGHGLSSKPNSGYDFDSISSDIYQLIQKLGLNQPLLLIGHSWGGYSAMVFAAEHPDLVKGLVLVDGGIMELKTQWKDWETAKKNMTPPSWDGKSKIDLLSIIRDDWLHHAWSPEVEQAALSSFEIKGDRVSPRLKIENHMQIAKAIWALTPSDYHQAIEIPVLIVRPLLPDVDPNDSWQADKTKQIEKALQTIPNSELVELPETIHDIPWHKPEILADLIRTFMHKIDLESELH